MNDVFVPNKKDEVLGVSLFQVEKTMRQDKDSYLQIRTTNRPTLNRPSTILYNLMAIQNSISKLMNLKKKE